MKRVQQFNLSKLKQNLGGTFDLLICCCSFEERCISLINNIDLSKVGQRLVFYNEEIANLLEQNRKQMLELLGESTEIVALRQSDPIFTADSISNALDKTATCQNADSILLDITTFTHESLLIVIRLLQIKYPKSEIICAYTNAHEYCPDLDVEEKWLSKGVVEFRSVLGYAGSMLPAQKTYLMLIVGYEYERATSIINILEPNQISLAFGKSDDATTEKNCGANEHYMRLVEGMAANYTDIDCFEIKCNDPFATKKAILEKCKDFGDSNIIIVPLNNKISTVAVAMAATEHENIQVCYAPAQLYNYSNYSKPGDICYFFKLNS